jgi:two-component system, sensor histidine kinase and response regulator
MATTLHSGVVLSAKPFGHPQRPIFDFLQHLGAMKSAQRSIAQRLASAAPVLVGAAVLLGWALDMPIFRSVFPGTATLKVAAAFCFILSGIAFWLGVPERVTGKAKFLAIVSSVIVLLTSALTLAKYLLSSNLGRNEALIQVTGIAIAPSAVSMLPNTALAFVLLSTALLLLAARSGRTLRAAAGLLCALTALLGLFAVLGWAGVKLGYGWGELTNMTLPAGALFLLLGSACAARAWRSAELQLAISRRLLTGFCLALLIFVALKMVSNKSAEELAETVDWVRHTHEVLARIQKVNSDLLSVQTGIRGFVISGRQDALAPYQDARRELEEDERILRRLTADNPRQQRRLTTLGDLSRQHLAYSEEILDLNRQGGITAVAGLMSTGRGLEMIKNVEAVIGALGDEERDLLTRREARASAQTARTSFVLSIGTFIGFALLLTVLFFLNSEAAERRAAEATSRLGAEIVRSAGDAVITKTPHGIITSWNPGAERIFGYTAQEAVGRSVLMFIPADCADEEMEILAKIGRGERVDHFETVRVRKDGHRANVSVTVSPLKEDSGRIVGAVKILRDITERKQSEEALRASEERFRTMANSIPQLTWIARADGSIYWYNNRWYEYTGTTLEQMEGWGWQTVHDPQVLPKVMGNWTTAINSGEPFEMEFPLLGGDGKFRAFLTRIQPLKDAEGRVVQWFGTNTDVDELKQMEESLRASQARLHSTLAAGSIGTWTWDIVNDRLTGDGFIARMFAIEPAAAAKGLPAEVYLRAVMEQDQPVVAAALASAIQSCGHYDIEYRVRNESGEIHWLQAKGRVDGDAAGNALHFHGAVMDITERKRTEGRFRRLVDSNAQGVVFWNKNGEITESNDAFLSIVGYSREDQGAGRVNWATMSPPEYAELDRHSLEELAAKGTCTPFEKEYIRKDGARVPVLLGAATFEDNPDEGVCFVIDITERKRTDQALRESEEHFRFLNDLSRATRTLAEPKPIMAVTTRMLGEHLAVSRCVYASVGQDGEHFFILHDYTAGRASAVGDYPFSLLGARAVSILQSGQTLIIRNLEAEVLPGDGADMVHPSGSKAMIVCPIVKDGGLRAMMAVSQTTPREWKPLEIVLVQDVVERCWALVERGTAEENIRRINAELEQRVVERTAAAEASNRAKSVFLSTMSHEIRTPMNAVLGYTQLMLRDPLLGAEAQTNLRIINRSGEHLLALINDVLDMSKIEAGQLDLNLTTFSLSRLLDDVAEMFRLRAEAKALRFEVAIDGISAPYIVADEGKMRQVLINLLGNAIKFTERGHVMLHVTLSQRNENKAWFLARVEDTGSGISDDERKKLFQSFSQTSSGINVKQGTGLGLAISRAHARLMGGDLTCTSSIFGTGSIFQFEVPVAGGDAKVAIRRDSPRRVIGIRVGRESARILVVDDLIENRDWLMKLLSAIGFSVSCSDNGETAIRDWRRWAPRLILMDIHMPVMDGLEATRRIKAEPGGKETAIVILTASVLDEDRRKVQQSGADDFLAKPCLEDALLEKIGTLLNIAYDYEELGEASGQCHAPTSASALGTKTLASLKQLPHELIEALRNATADGDKPLLNSLIATVDQTKDAEFARDLQILADRYEYDALTSLLNGR